MHLNVGLQKIRETVDRVEELQKSLAIKKNDLEVKNTLANQKLKEMVKDQQKAERERERSKDIQEQLKVKETARLCCDGLTYSFQTKTTVIEAKKTTVLNDLSKVEPAVEEAKSAVKSIRKQHLVEMRALNNPPRLVKVTLESICTLLGEPNSDWKQIRATVLRDTFINSVVNFNTEKIT